MSIGKNSIARAATAKAAAPQKKQQVKSAVFMSVEINSVELLKDSDIGDISKLTASIKKHGVVVPVVVAVTEDKFWLVDGARRLAAAKELGETQLPAMAVTVQNKREALSLAKELQPLCAKAGSIHEEKFKAIEKVNSDMPYYLL